MVTGIQGITGGAKYLQVQVSSEETGYRPNIEGGGSRVVLGGQ